METVYSLVDECEGTLLLRSSNGRDIFAKTQRDAINQDLEAGVVHGLVSKDAFARKNDLSHGSLDLLIEASGTQIVEASGHLYSTSYSTAATSAVASLLRDHLQQLQ